MDRPKGKTPQLMHQLTWPVEIQRVRLLLREVGAKDERRLEEEELRRRRSMAEESNESVVQAMEVSKVA